MRYAKRARTLSLLLPVLIGCLHFSCSSTPEIVSTASSTVRPPERVNSLSQNPTEEVPPSPTGPPAMSQSSERIDTDSAATEESSEELIEKQKFADPLYEKASIFDRYVSGNLEIEETQALLKGCHTNPSENIFCFSVVNFDLLEEKLKSRPSSYHFLKVPKGTVRAKFKNKKFVNWAEFKAASVNASLKAMNHLSPWEINKVKAAALSEKRCPNNAAIAVAATLEDLLPDRIDFSELAKLYEKGADCISNNPNDRENLLTRAGLFYFAAKNYRSASRAFWRSSNTPEAFVARPLYWLYRSRLELKENQRATLALNLLKSRYPFSFHTLVALTSSHKDPGHILSNDQPIAIRRSQKEPTVNHLIEQVEILHRLGFENSAARVLDWAINDFDDVEPELKVYLAELKRDQGDFRSKISILSEILYKHPTLISRRTMELYFPKVYFPVFEKNSSGLDPYLLLSIARRESAFNSRAVSSAKAQGLLQVMPATGRKLSRKPNLLNPEDNVHVGSIYLTDLLKKVGGQIHFALAAYNAGPHRLDSWTKRYEAIVNEPILFIDLIPYRETREYVASVLRNYYWYRRIHRNDEKIDSQKLLEIKTVNQQD